MTEFTAVSTVVSMFLLWIFVYWFYRPYRVDKFRQRMFELREELFDLAATGVLSFDDPSYGLVRKTMNGFIRFADRIDIVALVLPFQRRSDWGERRVRGFGIRYNAARKRLREDQRDALDRIVGRMHLLVFEQIIFGSPILLVMVVPALFAYIISHLGLDFLRRIQLRQTLRKRYLEPLDSLAFKFGARTT